MEPNITTMIAFKNQKEVPISSIKFNDDILTWAAFENSKNRFHGWDDIKRAQKALFSLWSI